MSHRDDADTGTTRGPKRKELPIEQIAAAYRAGEGPKSIGDRYGVSGQTIRNRLAEVGVELRPHGRRSRDLPMDKVAAEYVAGLGPKRIGDRYGVSAQTIRNRLAEVGVRLRPAPALAPADLPMDRVAAEYERGDSLPVLGRRYAVNQETIRRRLMRHGVQIRDQAEGQRVRYSRRGDVAGLAKDLGISEQQACDLLIKHGFISEEQANV